MKTPTNCPFCGDPLLNDYFENVEGATFLDKTCKKKLDHKITIRACFLDNDYVDFITIPYSETANIIWYMGPGHLIINSWGTPTGVANDLRLPFFEPNLSDYKKLMEKVKIYVLFS